MSECLLWAIRLGTIFIQLPPGYSPEYFADLQEFLTSCNNGLSLALEVRHPDWFMKEADRLNALLAKLNIARVLLDTRPIYNCPDDPQATSQRQKPNVPLQPLVTSNVAFVRFISHPDYQYNQSYLQTWATTVNNWLCQGKQVYFFVHCPQEVYSPPTARYFSQLLLQSNSDLADLPWNSLDPEPTQLSLF